MSISSTLDGRCVTTIVLTNPIRFARRVATSADRPGEDVRHEEQRAERFWINTEPQVEPIRGKALDDEATPKRVQCKQDREPQHDAVGSMRPENRASGDRGSDERSDARASMAPH
jgi:hypothetical protein